MKLTDVIGIAGTNGSGKDTLALLREQLQGSMTLSFSDMLRKEATKRGLDHSRQNLGAISTEWNVKYGPDVLYDKVMEHYQRERDGKGGLSIVSVRRVAEAETIKQGGGLIVWVDADQKTRYQRVQKSRGRADDMVSFEEFQRIEDAELYNKSGAKGAMDAAGIAEMADVKIENNFDTKEEYEAYLRQFFELD